MNRAGGLALLALSALVWTDLARADGFTLNMCDSPSTKGWSFYCTAPDPEDLQDQADPAPEVVPAEPEDAPTLKFPATDAMMAYRAHADELKYRAVLDPTPENVLAYMEINKEIADRAGGFHGSLAAGLICNPASQCQC